MGKKSINQQGFTLVEIMIGCGLLALMALAFSQLMTFQARQQGAVTVKAAFNQVGASVSAAAADAGAAFVSATKTVTYTPPPTATPLPISSLTPTPQTSVSPLNSSP